MGYRVSWLAAAEADRHRLLAALNLRDTGRSDEANEAPFSSAQLPTGWTIIWFNDGDYANEACATDLSRLGFPILIVHVDETCMHSTAALFENGIRCWRSHHEGDERIDMLESDGVLPVQAGEIESIARARQDAEDAGLADVDYLFDVPLDIAESVCGYRHDRWRFEWGEPSFTVAEPDIAPTGGKRGKTGLFDRLFRRQ